MDTDSLIVYVKADDTYKDFTEDVQARFETSSYEWACNSIECPLPKGKNNWINERWIGRKNQHKIFWFERKNLYLLNRWR